MRIGTSEREETTILFSLLSCREFRALGAQYEVRLNLENMKNFVSITGVPPNPLALRPKAIALCPRNPGRSAELNLIKTCCLTVQLCTQSNQ